MENYFWIIPAMAILALCYAWYANLKTQKEPEGSEKMKSHGRRVWLGSKTYLTLQYRLVTKIFIVVAILLGIMSYYGLQNPFVPVAFLLGAFFSALSGYIGMKASTSASSRTAFGASKSLNKGLKIGLSAATVLSFSVVGLGLLEISIVFSVLNKIIFSPENMKNGLEFMNLTLVHAGTLEEDKYGEILKTMLTFSLGASLMAFMARVGGGLFTKGVDVGGDLVGKVEAGIPEDSPLNPATIADGVGDNVGDVAGMGADLYESYVSSIISTAVLGASLPFFALKNFQMSTEEVVIAPMMISAIGILASIIGVLLIRTKESANQKMLLRALLRGTGSSSILLLLGTTIMAYTGWISWSIFGSVAIGIAVGFIMGQTTEYFTSDRYKPTRMIAERATSGTALGIIQGLAVGMSSTGISIIVIVIGMIGAFNAANGAQDFISGAYGIGFAAVGMLATLGINLAIDAFGPIADNAGANAEMSGLSPEVRERTDAYDSTGNTTAATGKGFAIAGAGLTAVILSIAYIEELRLSIMNIIKESLFFKIKTGDITYVFYSEITPTVQKGVKFIEISTATIKDFVEAFDIQLLNPWLLGGLLLGVMLPYFISSQLMKSVGRIAHMIVKEVRRQFNEIKPLKEALAIIIKNKSIPKKEWPDYELQTIEEAESFVEDQKCTEIATRGAQKEMLLPALVLVISTLAVSLTMGIPGAMGFCIGTMISGIVLGIFMNNSGGALDNSKKHVEAGNFGGKGSPTHKSAVEGDTVGDPLKDTAGPSLNILMKLVMMLSIIFIGLALK